MKKDRIIILGAGVMQGPAIRIARELGLESIVIDGSDKAPCIGLADRFEQIDLKDKEAIESFAASLMKAGGLGGIMTAGTDFSATVAWVAERLGLPGIPYQVALDASDKARMRERFAAAGLPSPRFIVVSSADASSITLPFDYPLVVKPVDNMGSRGCRRADNPADLAQALKDALDYSRSGRAIVEEYMDGPEFSVDAVVFRGRVSICGLADRHIRYPPYFIEMGHTIPSTAASLHYEQLITLFKQGIAALGIDNGAAKGDIKYTSRGPMIGEIAARLSGGYMSGWTYPYSSGIEPTRAAILIALGRDPGTLQEKHAWTSAERAFISIPGTLHAIQGVDEVRAMDGVKELFFRVETGSPLVFPENNVLKCGNIISAHPDREQAVHIAEKAAASILLHLACPDKATDSFLAEYETIKERKFPPDAYSVPVSIEEALDLLLDYYPGTDEGSEPLLLPFPLLEQAALYDYAGRSIAESLDAVRKLLGLSLLSATEAPGRNTAPVLGRIFWKALIRGGYQAAAYYIESLSIQAGS